MRNWSAIRRTAAWPATYAEIVTAAEVYELTTRGGATDFAHIIATCESFGPYCLIGGLAVNSYVEPVYTLDADLVVVGSHLPDLTRSLSELGFRVSAHPQSVNLESPESDLRIQFTIDERYQSFPLRAQTREVLGIPVQVARLEDVVMGKLWAYSDPERRLSKRKKDELDLIRLAEAYPFLKAFYPAELRRQLGAD
jgi:hypothetical protein